MRSAQAPPIALLLACAPRAPAPERPRATPSVAAHADASASQQTSAPADVAPPAPKDVAEELRRTARFQLFGLDRRRPSEVTALLVPRDCTAPRECLDRGVLIGYRFAQPTRTRCITDNCPSSEAYTFVHMAEFDAARVVFKALKFIAASADDSRAGSHGVYEARVMRDSQACTICVWPAHEFAYRYELRPDSPNGEPRLCETVPPALSEMRGQRIEVVTYRHARSRVRAEPPLAAPTEQQFDQALGRIEPLLRDCTDVPHGKVQLTFDVVGWSGTSGNVKVAGAGGTAAECLIRALRFARFPIFAGDYESLTREIEL
jgi:hypothetical protein